MFASKVAKPAHGGGDRSTLVQRVWPTTSSYSDDHARWREPCNFSGALAPLGYGVQAKLLVGPSDDPLEHEADRIADHVVSPVETEPLTRSLPSSTADEMRTTRDPARAVRAASVGTSASGAAEAPGIVAEAVRGPAEPLDSATRVGFEQRFDYDFGRVRVHRDGVATQAAAAVGARAFTAGADVVFGDGQYAPSTPEGKRLLAHELTHVAQQGAAGVVRRDTIGSAKLTPDLTRTTLSAQQKLQIDSVLRSHQIVIFAREKRARYDGQNTSVAHAISMVRREAGILLPSDDAIAAYIDSQFLKYFKDAGSASGGASPGLLRQGIPLPFGLDRPLPALEPGLTGADIDRIRAYLTTGHLAAGPGLKPMLNGSPISLEGITSLCRALVLPIISADKVGAIVGAEWSMVVREALKAPLPPPPPFNVFLNVPPEATTVDKPDKLVSVVGWQGTWHLTHKGAFEHTIQVQLTQGDGAVTRVFQFQVNATTGDVQAMVGVQVQSPDVTLMDKTLFKAVHAAIKASAFVQLIGGITNVGGNSASGSLTLQLQGGIQAAITLGPITATVQVGPTLTLQQGMSPDFSLNPAAQGGASQLPPGQFPPFRGITLFHGTF